MDRTSPTVQPPLAMLAELTYRCPLACPYCSNPTNLGKKQDELATDNWIDIFDQAARLGIVQLHISGGEPLSRLDIVQLIAAAHQAGLYTNLITSGIGLSTKRLDQLIDAGLEHVQLSIQGTNSAVADWISDYQGGFDKKMTIAREITARGLPLTLNAVMHRHNMEQLDSAIDLAVELGARRIEVACVQFHGWAQQNRQQLLPTRQQTTEAKETVARRQKELRGTLAFDFVPPDYYADYPKPCMGGWASTGLNVTPDGTVLPCHAAQSIEELHFASVHDQTLEHIWYHSPAFNAFRGDDWMPEPCRSCERKQIDFGGCRCQALALAGNARLTDPTCSRSPQHHLVDSILEEVNLGNASADFTYRRLSGSSL